MTGWDPHARLLTINEAAASISRPASTIRRWITEGRLRPTAQSDQHRYYLEADVLAVEATTRRPTGLTRQRALVR